MILALALVLCGVDEPPPVLCGTVVREMVGDGWIEIDIGEACTFHFTLGAGVVRPAMRPGSHVRFAADRNHVILGIEVIRLAPFAMEVVVEAWVAALPGARAWRSLLEDDLAEVERLGAPCYQVREAASKQLRRRGAGALRPLVWARRSGDPEVRARADALLREMGCCPEPGR